MNWTECGIVLAVSLLVTIASTPAARRIATALGAIDYPGERRVNKHPVPRMGGIAIFAGIVAGVVAVLVGWQALGWRNPFASMADTGVSSVNYVGVAVGMSIMFLVGAVDDVKNLPAKAKLLGQTAAACVVVASGLLLSFMQNPFGSGMIQFGWLSYPLTVLYLVAFANVINLIDGLDGLASGITAISAFTIFALSILTDRFSAAIMALILLGACLGFLKSNFHPASIFMGDSGSLLLGFSLGIVSLLAVARSGVFVSLLVPIVAAGVPITDTAVAIVRRIRAHQPIDAPDRGHIHHRLLQAGYSQRTTVLAMWAWTAALSACAVLMVQLTGGARTAVALVVVAITAFGIIRLRLLEPALLHHYTPRPDAPDGQDGETDTSGE